MNNAKLVVWAVSVWMVMAAGAYAQATGGQAGAGGYEQALRQADELVKQGQPAEAYGILQPYEMAHAGEERFDLLLGVAALDSGKPDKATLVLERVVLVNPANSGARMELARAYYQLGDMARARAEFERVQQQHPAGAARDTIQKYLQAIDARDPGQRTRATAYIEGGVGRDSNVNNSATQSQVTVNIPAVGPVTAALNPTNLQTANNYAAVAGGGEITHHLNPAWGLYAGADLRQRDYSTQKNFNSLGAEARLGVVYAGEANRVRAGLNGGDYNLGGQRYRRSAGVSAEWNHALSPANQLSLLGMYLQNRFADPAMQLNDFNQQAVGAGWVHALGDGKTLLSASVYGGTEKDTSNLVTLATPAGGRTDGAKNFRGLRMGGQTGWGESAVLYANAGWQRGDFSKSNPFFLVNRADNLLDLTLGANWHWDQHWSLRPQLSYVNNRSNIEIYRYVRADFSVTLRREFN